MNLTELYNTISAHISSNNKSLSLSDSLLNSPDVSDLLTHILSLSQLDLSAVVVPAAPGDADTSFTVSGQLQTAAYGLTNPSSSLQFFVDSRGRAQVIISLALPDAWKFTDSFSSLKDSIFYLFPESTEEFIFDDLSLSNAFLVLDSLGVAEGSIGNWNKGLNFSAELNVPDSIALAFASFILPETLSVQGSIDDSQPVPFIQLQADLSNNVSIGYLTNVPLSLVIATQERTIWPTEDPKAVSYIQLVSNISAGEGANSVSIPLTIEASYYAVTVDLEAYLGGVGVRNLAIFNALVNNVDLAAIIPDELQTNQGLQFSSLSLKVNVKDYSVESVSLWFEVNKVWSVIEEAVSFVPLSSTQLKFNFLVDNPLSSTDRIVTFSAITQIPSWVILQEVIELQDLEALLRVTRQGGTTDISGHLLGSVLLGDSVTLDVFFPIPLSSGNVQIESGKPIDLPGLNSLARLIGGDDFADFMPEEIAQLSNFTLEYANFELNLSKPVLEVFQIILTTTNDWTFLDGKITVRDVELNLDVQAPTGARTINATLQGVVTFGGADPVDIHLYGSYSNSRGGVQLSGKTGEGQFIHIGPLITDIGEKFGITEPLPDVLSDLIITDLQVAFDTATKDFSFLCETSLTIDANPANLTLQIDMVNTTDGYTRTFSGSLKVNPDNPENTRIFAVRFSSSSQTVNSITTHKSALEAAFNNESGEQLNLVDLVNQISGVQIEIENSLTTLILYQLQVNYEKETESTPPPTITTKYGIKGDFAWRPRLKLTSDKAVAFDVHAQIDLYKITSGTNSQNNKILGTICGEIQSTIDGLDFISLGVCYELTTTGNGLKLQLTIGRITFYADYANTAGDVSLTFTAGVKKGALTLGDVVTFFASLVDPSIDEFEFEPPWEFITKYDLALLLSSVRLKLKIIKATKEKKFSFSIEFENLNNPVPSELSTFLTIKKLSLEYSSLTKQTNIILDADFLGQQQQRLRWDPINEAPPEIPGQGVSVFELRYLGMGQHVTFENVNKLDNMTSIMRALEGRALPLLPADKNKNPLKALAAYPSSPSAPAVNLVFSPESEWLIGLDVSLLKTINLMVIFNDPVIYGLRIELYGELAKSFAGLQFEILYQRISDTLGKYHSELTLPDRFRYLQVGAVSITLPIVVVDIFTNGDFKVDLGFPWNFNFSRSFAIEVFPFTGAGGFYFNKLSGATTTLVPTGATAEQVAERGIFTPVYEFGLGLQIGLGKSFHRGPLNAEIQITVQGIITGVISWFNPIDAAGKKELYYKISGGVAIVGRLYGEVDFGIISVSVEVVARAMIIFVVEVYQPIHILLAADVSVKASVKVAFITISFSFSLRVEQEFTIPSPQGDTLPPWVQ